MSNKFTRRDFLRMSVAGVGAVVVSAGLAGCGDSADPATLPIDNNKATFIHGVASGDPLSDRVILWTRATPILKAGETLDTFGDLRVGWEVATDAAFTNLIRTGNTTTNYKRDFTVKVDAVGLAAGTDYYFRFICNGTVSAVAKTRTLPEGDVAQAKFAVVSCANYHCGYFNVYKEIAKQNDLDAVLHLGDYIYEYGDSHSNAAKFTKESGGVERKTGLDGPCITLADYRSRYALHHLEPELQEAHHKVPFIAVWDDHELANDVYLGGTTNYDENGHSDELGEWAPRRAAALQTYFEWIPIRPAALDDNLTIKRQFKYGDLVDLIMMDTRVVGRELPVDLFEHFTMDPKNYKDNGYLTMITGVSPEFRPLLAETGGTRSMLGQEQFDWLETKLSESTAKWQVLGQQVPMARLEMPEMPFLNCFGHGFPTMFYGAPMDPAVLAQIEVGYKDVIAAQKRIAAGTPEAGDAELVSATVPFRSTAWDGYNTERTALLQKAKDNDSNLIVLAGDTHNFWANHLTLENGESVGVEFAIGSISSYGQESYFGLDTEWAKTLAPLLGEACKDTEYFNLANRGFLLLGFTKEETTAEFKYIDTAFSRDYQAVAGPVFKVSASDATKVNTVANPENA